MKQVERFIGFVTAWIEIVKDRIWFRRQVREVWFGELQLLPVAHHWAVRVGQDHWYEVDGTGKIDRGQNTINCGSPGHPYRSPTESSIGATCTQIGPIGFTNKTNYEITQFNKEYLERHPIYDFLKDNCQEYVYEFVDWLTDGKGTNKLPPMEGVSSRAKLSVQTNGTRWDATLFMVKEVLTGILEIVNRFNEGHVSLMVNKQARMQWRWNRKPSTTTEGNDEVEEQKQPQEQLSQETNLDERLKIMDLKNSYYNLVYTQFLIIWTTRWKIIMVVITPILTAALTYTLLSVSQSVRVL